MDDIDTAAYFASQAVYDQPEYHQLLIDLGYIKDDSLSTHNTSTYYNDNHAIVSYRGTQTFTDIDADATIALGTQRLNPEFKKAKEIARQAKSKYSNIYTTGHSLGGTKAIESANDIGAHAIAFNPGTGLFKLKTGTHRVYRKKQDIISSRIDGANVHTSNAKTTLGHSLSEFDDQFRNRTKKYTPRPLGIRQHHSVSKKTKRRLL